VSQSKQVSWLKVIACAAPYPECSGDIMQTGSLLQWRDRAGFKPASLFNPVKTGSLTLIYLFI